jgi:integrase/recombinase XerC
MTLELYRGDLLALTHEWTNLHDDELKRRAVRAAGDKDVGELVSLTTAYLAHRGGRGSSAAVSEATCQ